MHTESVPAKKARHDHGQTSHLDDPDSDDLDDHSKAAIKAMASRDVAKKAQAKATAAAKKAAAKATAAAAKHAPGKSGTAKSEPTTSVKAEKPVKAEVKSLKPVKAEVAEISSKKKCLQAIPKDCKSGNPSPVYYNGGVIYTSQSNKKFKTLTVATDKYTERSTSWGNVRTKAEAWKIAIEQIDAKRSDEAKKKK